MSASTIQRFETNGIEAVSATVQLPNASSIQIAVVYRSPCVPRATMVTVLTRLLRHVTLCTTPCVILGDFNEYIVHHHNSAIFPLMSRFSFQQLVQCPTTAQGTLIDHVYHTCQPSRIPRDCPANLCIVPLSRGGALLSCNFVLQM